MAKKVTKKRGHGDFGTGKGVSARTVLEREYYEDILLTDPDTGEKKLYKKVKIKRYKTVSSLPSTRDVRTTEHSLPDNDSFDGYGDEGVNEE